MSKSSDINKKIIEFQLFVVEGYVLLGHSVYK